MLPLGRERALALADAELEVFLLMPDGTERTAEGRDEIAAHDGLFGVERQTWHGCQKEMKSGNQTNASTGIQGMLPSM